MQALANICVTLGIAIVFTAYDLPLARAEIINAETLKLESNIGENEFAYRIDIGIGISVAANVAITDKGNGILNLLNLSLRIVDRHDDGFIYDNGCLRTSFIDITGDGFKDIVIMGTLVKTGEKEGDPVTRSAIFSIYVFDPIQKQFLRLFHWGSFDFELN
jgi:hypothetical protein